MTTAPQSQPDLLPCPFCGSAPEFNEWPEYGSAQVCCENEECEIQPHSPGEHGGPAAEIAAWNRRAAPFDVNTVIGGRK